MAEQVDSTSTDSATTAHGNESRQRSGLIRRFLEMIRFSHTVFALPFAALGCIFSIVVPSTISLTIPSTILRLLGVLLCMVFARSAAMSFNRVVDVNIDAANPRTASRHIPSGELSTQQVWAFFFATSLCFVLSCLCFIPNWLPLVFSVPVLVWICGYSLAKRFTSAAHLWLGVALALSPVCAWIAMRGEEVVANPADVSPAIGLAIAIAFWVAGFDIIYACQDAEFDRQSGLNSVPARFGIAGALRISSVLHAAMIVTLAILPFAFPQLSLGILYGVALLVVTALLIRQHAIVSPSDLGRVNVAFFNINAIISFYLSLAAGVDSWFR